eukprot:2026528-Ditylum_brightwellii.AAC.1
MHSVDGKPTSEGVEDTISQVTKSSSDLEFQYTKETEEDQELPSIDNDEPLLTQESVKENEKEQDDDNEKVYDTVTVEEELVQQETGKNVITTAMLARKQCLLKQRHSGHNSEKLEPRENSKKQE